MNSINDERGCSVCQPGKENYTTYNTRLRGKRVRMYQYDYRTESGELFACCAPTLEAIEDISLSLVVVVPLGYYRGV